MTALLTSTRMDQLVTLAEHAGPVGLLPSSAECGRLCGFGSRTAASKMVRVLEDHGLVETEGRGVRLTYAGMQASLRWKAGESRVPTVRDGETRMVNVADNPRAPKDVDWSQVDLTRSPTELAAELGVSRLTVYRARKAYSPSGAAPPK